MEYGVTKAGFKIKPFSKILEEKAERSQQMFGSDIDLRSTSVLRKLLDISSFEDHELWKGMEQLYYSNFVSTASGAALDHLGEDVGVARRFLKATGNVKLQLANAEPERIYHLPLGTLVETDPPVQHFRTLASVHLSQVNSEGIVEVEALGRGITGNVAANGINKINPSYLQQYLSLIEIEVSDR